MDTTYATNSGMTGGMGSEVVASDRDRTYATFVHLAPMLSHLAFPGVGAIIVALVMWQVGKDRSDFVDDHGKEALNFHITLLIYGLVSSILIVLVVGFGMLFGVFLLWLIAGILATRAANLGRYYRYPMCLRLVR